MLIKRLLLNNYSIHSELELNFTPGINGIVGENGSGKSTVLDALRFAVTGTSILDGRVADNVSWGHKSGSVVLEFRHGDSDYTIERRIGKSSGQTLTTPDGKYTKQAEIQSILEGMFTTTFESLLNNVFVPQGRIEAILFATNTQRLKEIQRIIGLDNLALAEKALGLEVNSIQLTVGLKEQIMEVVNMITEARKEHLSSSVRLKEVEEQVNVLQVYAKQLEDYLATEKSRAALQKVEHDVRAYQQQLVEAEGECSRLQTDAQGVATLVSSFKEQAEDASRRLVAIEATSRQMKAIESLRAKIREAEGVLRDAPPSLPELEPLQEQIDRIKSTISLRTQQLDGSLPRPKLGREQEIEGRLKELEVQWGLLKTLPSLSSEEMDAGFEIKKLTHECEVFETGVCPTCSQAVSHFDSSQAQERIRSLKEYLSEEERSRKESHEALRRSVSVERAELQGELSEIEKQAVGVLQEGLSKLKARLGELQKTHTEATLLVNRVVSAERDLKSLKHQLEELGVPEEVDVNDSERLRKIVALYESTKTRYSESQTQLQLKQGEVAHIKRSLVQAQEMRSSFPEIPQVDAEGLALARHKVEELKGLREEHQQLVTQVGIARARIDSLTESSTRLSSQYENETKGRKWVTFCKRVRDIVHVNGLPTLMMREYASILNRRISHYLSVWEAPFNMELDDTLSFIAQFHNGLTHSASRLSGGQQIVASTSFRLAMVETFAREIGLLVLDEPSNYLDADNIYHLQQLLLRMKETTCATGRQILLVTHEASLGGFFDNTITLRRMR